MRTRKYLGPVAGLAMSLALAGIANAGFSSDRWVSAPIGKNTPIFQNISFTTFKVWSCSNHNSDYNAYFDWMHHWPLLPSTGTQEVYYPCHNQAGTWTYTWSAGSRADYSVEYTHTNNSSVTTNWSASY
jgi:hypothetical protein